MGKSDADADALEEILFDSVDTIKSALEVFAAMLAELEVNCELIGRAAGDPNLLATDLADCLVKKEVPFQQTHEIVAKPLAYSISKHIPLDQIGVSEMKKFSSHLEDDIEKIFGARCFPARRQAIGTPSAKNTLGLWRGFLTCDSAKVMKKDRCALANRTGCFAPVR